MTKQHNTFSAIPPALKFHKTLFLLEKLMDRALTHRLAFTLSQWMILMAVKHKPECTQRAIAEHRNVTQAAVSRQIEILKKKKLVARVHSSTSRREYALTLTPLGEAIAGQGLTIVNATIESILTVISANDRRKIERILDVVLKQACSLAFQPTSRNPR